MIQFLEVDSMEDRKFQSILNKDSDGVSTFLSHDLIHNNGRKS